MLQILVNTRYDFVGGAAGPICISARGHRHGLGHIAYSGGLRYGIDFSGGTLLQVRFERPITVDAVRTALDAGAGWARA